MKMCYILLTWTTCFQNSFLVSWTNYVDNKCAQYLCYVKQFDIAINSILLFIWHIRGDRKICSLFIACLANSVCNEGSAIALRGDRTILPGLLDYLESLKNVRGSLMSQSSLAEQFIK